MKHSAATRIAYAAAILILGAGAMVSSRTGDWDWMARAGSLIVVVGILLTSTQVIENTRRLRLRRQKWEASRSTLRDWASDDQKLTHSRNHDEHLFENERSGLYLLVAGTLVWGFGDLLGLLIA